MGAPDPTPSEGTRVTTPTSARRAALAIVGPLIALVVVSMVTDGGRPDDESAEDAEEEAAPTTSTTRRRSNTTIAAAQPGAEEPPPPLERPVAGFESESLIVVSTVSGAWSIPLAGGPPLEIGRVPDGNMGHLVDGSLVGYGGGISLRDGTAWQFDVLESTDEGAARGRMGWLIGPSDADTIIWGGEGFFAEYAGDGSLVGQYEAPDSLGSWSYPRAVVGRQALYEGPHGLLAYDLDTGRLRRLTVGSFVAAAGPRAVVERCDDDVRCRLVVIDVESGEQLVELPQGLEAHPLSGRAPFQPIASPDGERVAVGQRGNEVAIIDITTGEPRGRPLTIPPEALEPSEFSVRQVRALWSSDGTAALVFVTGQGGPQSTRPVHFATWIDRDGATLEPRDDLAEIIRHLSRSSGDVSLFVTDEEVNTWIRR